MSELKFQFGLRRFIVDDEWVSYRYVYGNKNIRVRRKDISGVSLEGGLGYVTLKLIGNGTMLAEIPKMPRSWGEKAQDFLLHELGL